MAIAPAKPSMVFNSSKVFVNASSIVIPSVTRVTIFVAVALLTMSSPTPVQLTAQKELA